jgi:amino acid adenylation domain-containing protein
VSEGLPAKDIGDRIAALAPERLTLLRRQMAAARAAAAAADRIPRTDRSERLPLSFAQQRLWFLDQLTPGLPTYKSPWAMRLHNEMDAGTLEHALTRLVERHEILRTRYPSEDGLPYQVIDPPRPVALERIDLSGLAPAEREPAMREAVLEQARRPVDLAAGPALRPVLMRLAADDHVLMLDMHHITTDGWSTAILVRELMALYQGIALAPLPIQYADFAAWQRGRLTGGELERLAGRWKQQLADLSTLELPTDRPRPVNRTWSGGSMLIDLPSELRAGVERLSRSLGATPITLWLAGFLALLSRYTGQREIVTGSVISGRTRSELESLAGFFANTVVLRTDLGANPTFAEVVGRTQQVMVSALDNQDLPFDKVVDALRPPRDPSRNPLFDVCFVYQGTAAATPGQVSTEQVPITLGTSRFDLVMYQGVAADGTLAIGMEYSTELFDEARVRRFVRHYETIMNALVSDLDRRMWNVPLLEDSEWHRQVVEWNRTEVAYPTDRDCLHALVERRVHAKPDAPAVRCGRTQWTYSELNAFANRVAWWLRRQGVAPDERVGVLLERSPELVAALLGVLKAGACYLPLDARNPDARLAWLLEDAGCRFVVTSSDFVGRVPASVRPVLGADVVGQPEHDPPAVAVPGNLAYVIYTSGSTGTPKGVLVPHHCAVNFVTSIAPRFELSERDTVLQFSNPTFDVSVFDMFGALSSGAVLVLAPRETLQDAAGLAALLRHESVTVAAIAPAMLSIMDSAGLPALRAICAAGEVTPYEVVNRWQAPGRVFHNGYGPTETTVLTADHACGPERLTQPPPMGRPLPNQRAYVLDRFGNPVPVGVRGELYVAGAGVTRGYLGRPALTAQRYVPDPFGPPGGRLYRTGDVVSWNPHGELVFHGRADDQVKIRGFRVEPGEVRQALLAHPDVATAVVVARDDGHGLRLVAYLVPAPGHAPTVDALRAHLGAALPDYMVPAAFMYLEALPLTASGKIDHRALPAPDHSRPDLVVPYVPPRTDTERRLAELIGGVTGIERVGVDDNFFTLGGNSLQATQLVSRIQQAFGIAMDLRTFFGNPTIAALAKLADAVPELSVAETEAMLAELGELTDEEVRLLLAQGGEG